MRVLLPLNAVPLFSLRASHEAFNRTNLTMLNPVNHEFKKPSYISFRAYKIVASVDKPNNFASTSPIALLKRSISTMTMMIERFFTCKNNTQNIGQIIRIRRNVESVGVHHLSYREIKEPRLATTYLVYAARRKTSIN